jgi:hypothetical protein
MALDGPNPEYPWPPRAPQITPAEHTFGIWEDLKKAAGRQFLDLTSRLFIAAEAYL